MNDFEWRKAVEKQLHRIGDKVDSLGCGLFILIVLAIIALVHWW